MADRPASSARTRFTQSTSGRTAHDYVLVAPKAIKATLFVKTGACFFFFFFFRVRVASPFCLHAITPPSFRFDVRFHQGDGGASTSAAADDATAPDGGDGFIEQVWRGIRSQQRNELFFFLRAHSLAVAATFV